MINAQCLLKSIADLQVPLPRDEVPGDAGRLGCRNSKHFQMGRSCPERRECREMRVSPHLAAQSANSVQFLAHAQR